MVGGELEVVSRRDGWGMGRLMWGGRWLWLIVWRHVVREKGVGVEVEVVRYG